MAEYLDHPATTEVVVHEPERVGVEQDGRWFWHDKPELTRRRVEAIAILAASMTDKRISSALPSCVSSLPDGQRIKILMPPAVMETSLCIRKRALTFTPTLEWLDETGYFDKLDPAINWPSYFRKAIASRKTIILSGGIGESKTTAAEAMLRAIPHMLRLVTIEGSPEWIGLSHPNWCATFFDEADPLSATKRVQDAMQLRPDWLCFQEVRGSEAWSLLRSLKIGTPGITTVHAPTALNALDSLESMVRQSSEGRVLSPDEIHKQLRQYVGVVAHCARFLPERDGESVRYRMTQVVDVGRTPQEDRIISARPVL